MDGLVTTIPLDLTFVPDQFPFLHPSSPNSQNLEDNWQSCIWPFGCNCCCSVAKSSLTYCNPVDCSTPGSSVLHYFPELAQTHVHWVSNLSNHLILCHPLLLLPSIFLSITVFSNKSVLHIRWPKCWSFSFSISPSNEYSGLISFRIDWLDLLAVQGTLKSLLQHHSLKASILWHSAFLMVRLSHPYRNDVTQLCPTLCNPVDCSLPGSSVQGFSRQEYQSSLPFPSPGDLPNPGIEPRSIALQTDSLPFEP